MPTASSRFEGTSSDCWVEGIKLGRIVLILGGARSGKSSLAEQMAVKMGGRIVFIATARADDDEMLHRILAHRASRPDEWFTIEEPLDLAGAVLNAAKAYDVAIVDCLTLWVSNHLCALQNHSPQLVERLKTDLEKQIAELVEVAKTRVITLIIVSNEVGLGLVPSNALGRAYRDLLGAVNRRVAEDAEQVLLMVAGLPLDIKQLSRGREGQ